MLNAVLQLIMLESEISSGSWHVAVFCFTGTPNLGLALSSHCLSDDGVELE